MKNITIKMSILYLIMITVLLSWAMANNKSNKYRLDERQEVDMSRIIMDISLDGVQVPEVCIQGNLSFLVAYRFEIDNNAHPRYVTAMQDDYLDKEQVVKCIKKWRFSGLSLAKRTKYVCILNWEHNIGWVSMLIYNDNFSLMIKLNKSY